MILVVCEQCGRGFGPADIVNHLRRDHGVTEPFERWPDGEPVIEDTTLEPGDFR